MPWTTEQVEEYAAIGREVEELRRLRDEVLPAYRKLVADLRAVHATMKCCEAWPCTTIRIIHNAGL